MRIVNYKVYTWDYPQHWPGWVFRWMHETNMCCYYYLSLPEASVCSTWGTKTCNEVANHCYPGEASCALCETACVLFETAVHMGWLSTGALIVPPTWLLFVLRMLQKACYSTSVRGVITCRKIINKESVKLLYLCIVCYLIIIRKFRSWYPSIHLSV